MAEMFQESFTIKTKASPWAMGLSMTLQALVVAVLFLIPLLDYYQIPLTELTTYLVAPPPPPPPPPPPAAKIAPKQFDMLTQPKSIPDDVAVVEEVSIVGVIGGVPGGYSGGVGGVLGGIIANTPTVRAPPPPPPVKKAPPPTPKRIRVGGAVQKARMLKQIRPQYPPLARQARIQGTVKLTAIIAKDGTVQELKVVSGHPLLIPSALQAVKQWRYRPTLLNGTAVEVVTQIDVNFTLSG